MFHTNRKGFRQAIHWIPRVAGTLLFWVLLFFVVGEGIPNPMKQSWAERIELLAMFIMWFGLVIAWKAELFGGILVLLGYTSFCTVEWQAPSFTFPFGLFPFIGLSYIFSGWSTKRQNPST